MIAAVGEDDTKSQQLAESMQGLLLSRTAARVREERTQKRGQGTCNLTFSDLNVCL